MVVLYKRIGNSKFAEFHAVVGFHEKTARVLKDFRTQFPNTWK